MGELSPLVYDAGTAGEVWRRVSPTLPPYGPDYPAGACCPLPRREEDSEAALGRLIDDGAALYAACRRCAVRAPGRARPVLRQLAEEQQRSVRALVAAYFLLTGRWRQPPVPAAGLQEPWLTALRRVFLAESVLQRDCAALAEQMENGCLRQLLAAEAERAAARGKSLAALLENSLTTANNLLKW